MKADALNFDNYPVRTETTGTKYIPTSHVCSTYDSKLKDSAVDENWSHICSTDEDDSKGIIFDECSTEEDKSDWVHKNINTQKDANNETEYEESSVTDEVTSYFNIYKCSINILNRLYVKFERACMATTKDKYYTKTLEALVDYNDRNNALFSNEKIQQPVSRVMAETGEE